MAKKEKIEEEQNGRASNDILGSLLKENKDSHYNNVVSANKIISTGSLQLDALVHIRSGSVIRLTGAGNELGKTSESFVLAANYMATMPKSKTIFIKAEARLSPEMQARSGHKFVTNPEEWDYGTVFVFSTNVFQTFASTIETLLKGMHELGEHLCIILDSLDGLILKEDTLKDLWGSENQRVSGVPLLTKLMFRRLALPINHYDALLIVTSQYSAEIKLDPYSKEPPRQTQGGGGASIGHQSDYVFGYSPRYNGDWILEDENAKPDVNKNKILGVYSTVEIKKSASNETGAKLKIPIRKGRVGSAIWVQKEAVDMLLQYQLANRKGAWISFDEGIVAEAAAANIQLKPQIQGMAKLYEYMEVEKDVFDFFYEKIKKLIIQID